MWRSNGRAFRDDWTVADLDAALALLAGMDSVDEDHIGILGHCWGGRVAWLGACSNRGFNLQWFLKAMIPTVRHMQ